MSEELIYHKVIGEGEPLLILHGLFGSSDNWLTLANKWAEKYQVILCDARNHGRSFHSEAFSYALMAQDVKALLHHLNISQCLLLGHSMGGKTAMYFAQQHPEYIKAMIIADIGPKSYPPHHQLIFEGFEAVDLENTNTRGEATKQVQAVIADPGVSMFLLKNLYWKEKGQLAWRMNLSVLKREVSQVIDALPTDKIDVPTLFIRGDKSDYILNEDWPEIKKQFTHSHLVTLKNAGHWLHAEQPDFFYNTVSAYWENQQ